RGWPGAGHPDGTPARGGPVGRHVQHTSLGERRRIVREDPPGVGIVIAVRREREDEAAVDQEQPRTLIIVLGIERLNPAGTSSPRSWEGRLNRARTAQDLGT